MFSSIIEFAESFAVVIIFKLFFAKLILSWREINFFKTHSSTSKSINSFSNESFMIDDILSWTIELCLIHNARKLWNRFVNHVASYLNWSRLKFWITTEATWGIIKFVLLFVFPISFGTTKFTFVRRWHPSGVNSSTSSSSTSFRITWF